MQNKKKPVSTTVGLESPLIVVILIVGALVHFESVHRIYLAAVVEITTLVMSAVGLAVTK